MIEGDSNQDSRVLTDAETAADFTKARVAPEITVPEQADVTPDDMLAAAEAFGMAISDEEAAQQAADFNQMLQEKAPHNQLSGRELLAIGVEWTEEVLAAEAQQPKGELTKGGLSFPRTSEQPAQIVPPDPDNQ